MEVATSDTPASTSAGDVTMHPPAEPPQLPHGDPAEYDDELITIPTDDEVLRMQERSPDGFPGSGLGLHQGEPKMN